MIIKDVLKELADHNIFTKGKRFLTATKISVMILINEQLRASQTGDTWALSITDIMRITENSTKPSLFKALAYLCELGFYETSPNPVNKAEQVYSPILTEKKYDSPLFIDFNWVDRDLTKGQNLVVSPRVDITTILPTSLSATDYGIVYTLVSYNPSAFRNPKVPDAAISSREAVFKEAPILKNEWMCLNNVKNIPHGLDLASIDTFWEVVTEDYIVKKCMNQPETAPVFPWFKISDDYWNPSIPLGTRDALYNKLLLQVVRGQVTREEIVESSLPTPDTTTPYRLVVKPSEKEENKVPEVKPVGKPVVKSAEKHLSKTCTYLDIFTEVINSSLSEDSKELILRSLSEYLVKHEQ